jgi:hypothetical protein
MTTKAYHNAAPPEYNEKDQPPPIRRWRPGEPIPRRGPGIEPNAYEALTRHALAAETATRTVSAKRKTPPSMLPPFIPAEVRARYKYELAERAKHYLASGMVRDEAERLALDDLGCVEFWSLLKNESAAQRGEEAIAA